MRIPTEDFIDVTLAIEDTNCDGDYDYHDDHGLGSYNGHDDHLDHDSHDDHETKNATMTMMTTTTTITTMVTPEGDEASVEANAADRVVMRTKAREASCTLLNNSIIW